MVYFEKQFGALYYFQPISGFRISKNGQQAAAKVSAADCAQLCLDSSDCKSFSIDWNLDCILSNKQQQSTHSSDLTMNLTSVYFSMKVQMQLTALRPKGEVTSPLFPNSYPSGIISFATVLAPQGARFKAQITRLNLRRNSENLNECDDRLTINTVRFCNEQVPWNLTFLDNVGSTLLPSLTVELASKESNQFDMNSQSYSYRIGYEWDWVCESDEAQTLQTSSTPQRLASPGFPNLMEGYGPCKWVIKASPDSHVYLSFVKVPTGIFNHLSVTGENGRTALKNGDFGNNVTITYRRGEFVDGDTFELYYLQTNGNADKYSVSLYTENETVPVGNKSRVSIPFNRLNLGENNQHASIIDLHYKVMIRNGIFGSNTLLVFSSLGFGKHEWFDECYDGFVTIKSAEETYRFCGTDIQGKTVKLEYFGGDISISARLYQRHIGNSGTYVLSDAERQGFKIDIQTGLIPNDTGSEPINIISKSLNNHPALGTDSKYLPDQTKNWNIRSNASLVAKLNFSSFELATIPDYPNICDNDRLSITNYLNELDSSYAFKLCGKNIIDPQPLLYFGASNSTISVLFESDDRHSATGFNFSVSYARVYPMRGNVSIVNEEGYLTSTNYPQLVTRQNATWRIESNSFSHCRITVHFGTKSEVCKHILLETNGKTEMHCVNASKNVLEFTVGTKLSWFAFSRPNRFAAEVTYFQQSTKSGSKSSISGGGVAGIVIGVLLLISLFGAFIYFFLINQNQSTANGGGIRAYFNKTVDSRGINNQELSDVRGTT